MTNPSSMHDKQSVLARLLGLIPPWLLVIMAIISVQVGAALAKQLFETTGPAGTVFLRTFFGGLIFVLLWRPPLRGYSRHTLLLMLLYGIIIAANMLLFYAAIQYIPLGITVAIAFAGPLTVAVFGSRRASDLMWVALAGVGVLLLSPFVNTDLNLTGVLLAVLTAVAWGAYIVVTPRVSTSLNSNASLALSMCIAAVVAAFVGLPGALKIIPSPALIGLAILVALLSSAIPFGLEFQASKQLQPRVFGMLLAMEPVAATLIGWLFLQEALEPQEVLGIVLVTIAAAMTARSSQGLEVPKRKEQDRTNTGD